MTKVITYNNIQLSFQADTSGIKASKAELAALTREVNNQRTPLERFAQKVKQINDAGEKLSPKEAEARLRAVSNTYLEASTKAGRYVDALRDVANLVPQLATETKNLEQQYHDLAKQEKEIAEIERDRVAQQKLLERQQEDKRLQVERQVLQFKKEQRQAAAAAAKQDAEIAAKLAANRKKVLKQERDDYVAHYDSLAAASKKIQSMVIQPKDLEAINAQIAKEKELAQIEIQKANRRRELERMVRRIFQNEGEIIATNRRRARREAEEYKKEVLAKYDAEIAAQEKRNQIVLKEEAALREKQAAIHRTLLKQERDEYVAHYDKLAAASRKLQSLVFTPAENAKILAERSAAAELELQNQRMGAGLGIQILEQSKQILGVRQQSVAAIQTENVHLLAQQQNLTIIQSLEQKLVDLKRQQLSPAQQKTQDIEAFRKREMEQAEKVVAEMKRKAAETMGVVDPADIKKVFDAVEVSVQKHLNLLKQIEREEQKIENNTKQKAAEEEKSAKMVERTVHYLESERRHYGVVLKLKKEIVSEEVKEDGVLQKLIADESRQNALVQKRMNMYRQMPSVMGRGGGGMMAGAKQFAQGASMGGMPGGMLVGMNPYAIAGMAVVGGIAASVKAYKDLRDNLVLLESQFGNVADAQSTFLQLRQLAAKSPLETRDLMAGAVTLKQYGIANSEVMPTMEKLAAVSGGSAERLAGLTRAFAQTSSAGKLMGQEVLQFVNSGFNPLNEMAKRTNTSMLDLRKMMENGLLTSQDMKDAFTSVTQEGGQFHGQMAKQAEELSAKYNAMIDSLRQVGESIGAMLDGPVKAGMEALTVAFTSVSKELNILAKSGKMILTAMFDQQTFVNEQDNMWVDLENSMIDYWSYWRGLDFSPVVQKQENLFASFEKRRLEAIELERQKREQARLQIEDQIFALNMMKNAENEYNRILMSSSQIQEEDNKKRMEEFRLESEKIANLKAQAEQASQPEGKRGSFQQLLDKYMKESIADQEKFADMLDKTPLAKMAREIIDRNEEAAKQANPQIAIMQKAKEIADMINFGMLTQQAGSQELARVMMENTQATQQQSQELPRTIQAGTVEAYQAMFGKDNTAKLQLSEQKKQNDKLSEANGILKQIAAKPGMKKV